jgi:NTF2-related export protein 1/2
MSAPSEEVEVKTSAEAAQHFLEAYYDALNRRQKLGSYYINACTQYKSAQADISINGAVLASPADFETLLEQQGTGVHYELESFDAHVANPDFSLDAPDHLLAPDRTGAKASVLVNAIGRIQYGRGKDALQQNFTEVFVLVPNWDAFGRGGGGGPRGPRRKLIMSQNFRAL